MMGLDAREEDGLLTEADGGKVCTCAGILMQAWLLLNSIDCEATGGGRAVVLHAAVGLVKFMLAFCARVRFSSQPL